MSSLAAVKGKEMLVYLLSPSLAVCVLSELSFSEQEVKLEYLHSPDCTEGRRRREEGSEREGRRNKKGRERVGSEERGTER